MVRDKDKILAEVNSPDTMTSGVILTNNRIVWLTQINSSNGYREIQVVSGTGLAYIEGQPYPKSYRFLAHEIDKYLATDENGKPVWIEI